MSSVAVVQLLSFLEDVQPAPYGGLRTEPGPVATVKEPCANCNGTGRVKRYNNRPCGRCGGNLQTNVAGRGWVWVDPYIGEEVGHDETRTTDLRSREIPCWTCGGMGVHASGKVCVWCAGKGRRRVAETQEGASIEDSALAVALAATRAGEALGLRQRGSFDALEDGLLCLHPRDRRRVYQIHVWGDAQRGDLVDGKRDTLSRSVRFLRFHIVEKEGRVRVPSEIKKWFADRKGMVARGPNSNGYQRRRRNGEIFLLMQDGLSHGQIAKRVGVDRSTVSRVLRGAIPAGPSSTAGTEAGQPVGRATLSPGEPREEQR